MKNDFSEFRQYPHKFFIPSVSINFPYFCKKIFKMAFGVCVLSVIPVRSEPSDKSEMVTQLLFGELFEISETSGSWLKIVSLFDSYPGWIDSKQCKRLSEPEADQLKSLKSYVASDMVQLLFNKSAKTNIPILIGSSLPGLKDNNMTIAGDDYGFDSEFIDPAIPTTPINIKETALQFINSPYLWGGRTPFGIDCSGLTQLVMKICGINIPRDAAQQASTGRTVDFISEVQAGDLAFFENSEEQIVHTGIFINEQMLIHSSGFVRIDAIDHEGIFNLTAQRYTHKLKLIKRFI